MIPETPAFYKLAVVEIAKVRGEANRRKAQVDRECDEAVATISGIIYRQRDNCPHDGIILYKESTSGRPHDPDIYVCSLCTATLHRPPISAELVPVSQEGLMKFFCK